MVTTFAIKNAPLGAFFRAQIIDVQDSFVFDALFVTGAAYATPAEVSYIIDGDTFAARVMLADDTKITVRVRLINVDTPEIHGECESEIRAAFAAKARLSELLPVGSVAELRDIKDDKYLGRIDARVLTADGRDVGNVLIHEKLGRPYSGGRRDGWCK